MAMLAIALEKGASVETMEKLLALQERWQAGEAKKAYVEAMAAFKRNPPSIYKNKGVSYGNTNYRHATLDNVVDVVGASLSEHGLSHSWRTEQTDTGAIRVTCTLTHLLGHSESTSLVGPPDQSGQKNSIQAIGSTQSYLCRYTLLAITGLATSDMDDDGKRGADEEGFITDQQRKELETMMEAGNVDKASFCQYFNIPSLAELPAKGYGAAKTAITKRSRSNV
jgi:hypothetical protein